MQVMLSSVSNPKQVMSEIIEAISKEYLGHLKEKGNRGFQEASFFLDDMKVLYFGFKEEFKQMKALFSLWFIL